MGRILDLLDEHAAMDRLFEAAALANVTGAACNVDAPIALLRGHLAAEEAILLPLYRRLVLDPPPFAAAELVERDHGLIRDRLARLAGAVEPVARLRELRGLSHLLDHHTDREARGMKLLLQQTLEPHEQVAVLDAWSKASSADVPLVGDLIELAPSDEAAEALMDPIQRSLVAGATLDPELKARVLDATGSWHPGLRARAATLLAEVAEPPAVDPRERLHQFDISEVLRRLLISQRKRRG